MDHMNNGHINGSNESGSIQEAYIPKIDNSIYPPGTSPDASQTTLIDPIPDYSIPPPIPGYSIPPPIPNYSIPPPGFVSNHYVSSSSYVPNLYHYGAHTSSTQSQFYGTNYVSDELPYQYHSGAPVSYGSQQIQAQDIPNKTFDARQTTGISKYNKDVYDYFALPTTNSSQIPRQEKNIETLKQASKEVSSHKFSKEPSRWDGSRRNNCKTNFQLLDRSNQKDNRYTSRLPESKSHRRRRSRSPISSTRKSTSSDALSSIRKSYSSNDTQSSTSNLRSRPRTRSPHKDRSKHKTENYPRKSRSGSPNFSRVYNKNRQDKVSFEINDKRLPLGTKKPFQSDGDLSEEDPSNGPEDILQSSWARCAPADLHYQRDQTNPLLLKATPRLVQLCEKFDDRIIQRTLRAKDKNEKKSQEQNEIDKPEKLNSVSEESSIDKKDCQSLKSNQNEISSSESTTKSSEYSQEKSSTNSTADECIEKPVECASRNLPLFESKCSGNKSEANDPSEKEDSATSCSQLPDKPKCKSKKHKKNPQCVVDGSSSEGEDSSCRSAKSSSCEDSDEDDYVYKGINEMELKKQHPHRLHPELWYNDPGEMNDGPLCRCSLKAQRSGIRHGFYVGEENLKPCDPWSNNADRLHHYFVTISPPTNFLVKSPTIIYHDSHEFIFEGFSLLSHEPLQDLPTCQVIRFNIEYSVMYVKEKMPENFCVRELDMFYDFLFKDNLELYDLNIKAPLDVDGCPRFHFLPRFVRKLPDNGKEILSMNEVINYFLRSNVPLIREDELPKILKFTEREWLEYTDKVKGMIVTYPGKKPCSIRVDQLDRSQTSKETTNFPVVVHFGIRPPQLSYAGNPKYQKALREFVKFRHLLANMPKPSSEHKRQLEAKELRLQEMRVGSDLKREVTIDTTSEGFYRTGIMCDIVQHALLLPVLVRHLRFHQSLNKLEESVNYKFQTRYLLQLALTHPSYRENFGTNPDHARNSLTNCGVRQPQYGDKKIQYMNTHKRGINTLVNIMSRFGKRKESDSKITHNERLEFLGDAVVEFLTSIHLFHLFPSLEEGGLATYRAAVVQNQHLSVLAGKLDLGQYVLHAHGSDLCHSNELNHAMANCFEALMGAIFIDSNIEAADAVFSATLFKDESELHEIWVNYKPHPLQAQEPTGDRKWIETFPVLQKIAEFEESLGFKFSHIRLLARAFTDRSIGFNYLTLGSNQRLEFLGDTVLQIVASEYLYKYFPEHHEGHLSLLRSSLVNNRTQAVVCDDLNMPEYAICSKLKTELKTKDRADLLEAFLGALYIDLGLDYCRKFCDVCFFPRLQHFIINQEWNDPKSKLQQCCLTLRSMEGGEPDIPIYKVIECKGPTNTRIYTVAVYFRNKRLAKASGHSVQRAQMNAANEALESNTELFPQLAYQRRVIQKNIMCLGVSRSHASSSSKFRKRRRLPFKKAKESRSSSVDSSRSKCSHKSRYSSRKRRRDSRSPSRSRRKRNSSSVSNRRSMSSSITSQGGSKNTSSHSHRSSHSSSKSKKSSFRDTEPKKGSSKESKRSKSTRKSTSPKLRK